MAKGKMKGAAVTSKAVKGAKKAMVAPKGDVVVAMPKGAKAVAPKAGIGLMPAKALKAGMMKKMGKKKGK